jgi:hypothetical protein
MAGAGYRNFVASEVLTAAQVNTYLMQQSVMRFTATTGAGGRDTVITSPSAGMVVYMDTGDFGEGLYSYNGAAWRRCSWNSPWGVSHGATVASAYAFTSSTRQTITTAGTDITGLSATIDQTSNRLLKFTVMVGVLAVTAASTAFNFQIQTGASGAGTNVGTLGESKLALGDYRVFTYSRVYATTTTTAGQAYHVRVASLSANGIAITNDLGLGHFIIEDIGPSGNPV